MDLHDLIKSDSAALVAQAGRIFDVVYYGIKVGTITAFWSPAGARIGVGGMGMVVTEPMLRATSVAIAALPAEAQILIDGEYWKPYGSPVGPDPCGMSTLAMIKENP